MTILRPVILVCLLLPVAAFAQSADQEVVSAVDAPDPVAPGATLTYTVTLTNHGPDPATGGGLNINLPGGVTHISSVAPAGFTCNYLGNIGTCNMPSLPVGTYVITIDVTVNASLASFPDQDITATFFPSGTTIDPNNANNPKNATTTVNSPQVDLSLMVTDSPDPVFPDGTITYTVPVTNSGPDTATNVNFNVVPSSALAFQSATVPAGWSCTLPAVDALNATFTCSRASWAPGTDIFTVVFAANDENFGINDTTIQTFFGVFAGASDETDDGSDNSETESTQYTTPDADINITATDSPDPVGPDGDITYTVTVTNQGPDTPGETVLDVVGNGGQTRFVSLTVPAGWSCNPPAPGTLLNVTGFQCTHPSFGNGASAVFTVVTEASDDLHPNTDHNITQVFQAYGNVSDPDNSDNSVTVTTGYVVDDADMNIAVSDSPDPVSPDGDITYTVTVTNQGPDPATNARMTIVGNGGQTRFVSLTAPGGWTCNPPAPGTLLNVTNYECTIASLANGASAVFTVVTEASDDLHPHTDHDITQNFQTSSDTSDPDNADNSVTVTTGYVVDDADMNISASDSPDPVSPDGDITYTVTVTNQGPDPATNARMTIVGNGGQTRFVSLTAPVGWTCNPPAGGTLLNATNYECTIASLANGANAVFTVVTEASDDLHPNSDHDITQTFQVSSDTADPDNTDNSVTVTTGYVVNDADMNISVSDSPDPVAPDGDITYTVSVTNQGPDPATNARMTIVGNGGQTRFGSLTAPGGWTCNPPPSGTLLNATNYECTIASLANGASAVFTVVTEASDDLHPDSDHDITQTFTTSADEADPDGTDNGETETTLYDVSHADISVTNSDAPDPVAPGETITYSQSIANNGPDTATNAAFTQSVPAGTTFQSFAPSAGWTCGTPAVGGTGAITCTKPSMTSSESGTFSLVVNVIGTGTITSTVTGASDVPDPVANNTAEVTTTSFAPPSADLGITKTTGASSAPEGSTVTYTIVVTNDGPDAATNVVLTDTLPAELLFRSISEPAGFSCTTPAVGSTGTITCDAATLADGASVTFTLVVEVAASSGVIVNSATAASDTADANSGNDSGDAGGVTAEPAQADLEITKTSGAASAMTGGTISYTIVVGNGGPSAATNVVVTDDLPSGLSFVSATPTQGTCNASDPVTCNLGTILSGASASITLVTQVTATSGTVTNTANVTSAEGDTDASTSAPIPVSSAEVAVIPTASEWGLLLLALMLAGAAALKVRV